jgi:hypothetical protein
MTGETGVRLRKSFAFLKQNSFASTPMEAAIPACGFFLLSRFAFPALLNGDGF